MPREVWITYGKTWTMPEFSDNSAKISNHPARPYANRNPCFLRFLKFGGAYTSRSSHTRRQLIGPGSSFQSFVLPRAFGTFQAVLLWLRFILRACERFSPKEPRVNCRPRILFLESLVGPFPRTCQDSP